MKLKTSVSTPAKAKKAKKPSLEKILELRLPKNYDWRLLETLAYDMFTVGSISKEDYEIISFIARNRDLETYNFLSSIWGLQSLTKEQSTDPDFSIHMFESRYQLASLLKKFSSADSDFQAESTAITSFKKAETVCKQYNHVGYKKFADENLPLLRCAQKFIFRVIGEMPVGSGILKWAKHGPGHNLDTCGKPMCDSLEKYESWPYTVTEACVPYARFMIETDQRWMGALVESYRLRNDIPMHALLNMKMFWKNVFTVVDCNQIRFVPKTRLTKRSIAIEPSMNLRLQLATDGFIRKRLKRFGIDLDDQAINQRLARQGSEDGTLSTLDLSAASDTISLKICELLLPPLWYDWLIQLRSPKGELQFEETIAYGKLSSMGNGYTFAIQSLIFASLIYATATLEGSSVSFSKNAAVYGDDLIVPTQITPQVITSLQLAGFSINLDKSFYKDETGPVRESCGADWIKGFNVRPIFLREKPKQIAELFNDYNRLQRLLQLKHGLSLSSSKTLQTIDKWMPLKSKVFCGPYSDEDFYGYRHITLKEVPKVFDSAVIPKKKRRGLFAYTGGLFRFPSLEKRLKLRKSGAFHMRKLMADLSGEPDERKVYCNEDLAASGNRFDIGFRSIPMLRCQVSRTSFWCETYNS